MIIIVRSQRIKIPLKPTCSSSVFSFYLFLLKNILKRNLDFGKLYIYSI